MGLNGDPGTTPADEIDEAVAAAPTAAEPADPAAGAAGGGEEAPAATDMPNRRTAILRAGIIVGVLVLVFGIILPKVVDYGEVRDALAALTLTQFIQISIIGFIAWVACGVLFCVVLPGLSLVRGTMAYLILSGMGPSLPFGPWNMGVTWVVLRGWGESIQSATTGMALYGTISTLGRFALPLVAIVLISIFGAADGTHGTARFIGLLAAGIFIVATTALVLVVRSDRTADWLGRTVDRYVTLLLGRLRRPEHPDINSGIHRFRDELGEVVRRRGLAGLLANIGAQFPWWLTFVVALRFTGVPPDVITPLDVLAVFALTSVITIIPIAPGGAGVPELLYIAGLTSIAPGYESQITAGVFLFRLYVWFLPIPIAWILLKFVRRGRPMLPTTSELRSYAATG
jgi:putative heme transporter